MRHVFRESGSPLTESALSRAEQFLGRPIPPAYRTFLLAHNGGRPERSEFESKEFVCSVKAFFGLRMSEETFDLAYALETFGDRIPADYFPIARDPGGNLFLIRTAGKTMGEVVFWDHEREADDGARPTRRNLKRLADSFDTFLASLRVA